MVGKVTVKSSSIRWQGYRSGKEGYVVYYESDTESELPIRRITGTKKSDHNQEDPNYETKTYGLYDCINSNLRNAFERKKYGYIFFITKYQGKLEEYDGKYLLTGYYKINATADVQKLHLRELENTTCINSRQCQALKADEAVFLRTEDAPKVTKATLKSLGYEKKITRMTKIELSDEQVQKLLKKFAGKENAIEEYIEQHNELKPLLEGDDE